MILSATWGIRRFFRQIPLQAARGLRVPQVLQTEGCWVPFSRGSSILNTTSEKSLTKAAGIFLLLSIWSEGLRVLFLWKKPFFYLLQLFCTKPLSTLSFLRKHMKPFSFAFNKENSERASTESDLQLGKVTLSKCSHRLFALLNDLDHFYVP